MVESTTVKTVKPLNSLASDVSAMRKEIAKLYEEVHRLKAIAFGDKTKHEYQHGKTVLNEREAMVKRAIDDEKHVLISGDFIKSKNLLLVLRVVYPDNRFFPEITVQRYNSEVRRLGVMLSRIGEYKSVTMGHYLPANRRTFEPGKRINDRVWIIRNVEKYETYTASELYKAYTQERERLQQEYHRIITGLGWLGKGIKGDIYPTAYGPDSELVTFDEIDLSPINMTNAPRTRGGSEPLSFL